MPDPEENHAVDHFAPPHSLKDVQSFLGFYTYFLQKIYGVSHIAEPVQQLTYGSTAIK